MQTPTSDEVTKLLRAWNDGDLAAIEKRAAIGGLSAYVVTIDPEKKLFPASKEWVAVD